MKKFLCLIIISLTVICLLTGCRKQQAPTELHEWHHSFNGRVTRIIYEVRSTPTEIIDNSLLWDIDNVQLDLYFGWDAKRKEDFYYDDELVCFATYFFWTGQNNLYSHRNFSDYKNPPDAIFLDEISSDEFLSEKYEANYGGRAGFLRTHPPVFNKLHEPLSVTVPQEVFRISEENRPKGSEYVFRFGVTPVFYNKIMNVYYFGTNYYPFGKSADGITFRYYYYYYESGKISIGA